MKSRKLLIRKDKSESPALGVIFCGNAGLGQGVEQRGFTDVGKANDAALQTHEFVLVLPVETGADCTYQQISAILGIKDWASKTHSLEFGHRNRATGFRSRRWPTGMRAFPAFAACEDRVAFSM
jgi:hypothetical protein